MADGDMTLTVVPVGGLEDSGFVVWRRILRLVLLVPRYSPFHLRTDVGTMVGRGPVGGMTLRIKNGGIQGGGGCMIPEERRFGSRV